jgi:hypothetical protein
MVEEDESSSTLSAKKTEAEIQDMATCLVSNILFINTHERFKIKANVSCPVIKAPLPISDLSCGTVSQAPNDG